MNSRRMPGPVGDVLSGVAGARRYSSLIGKPKMILDWRPIGADVDFTGAYTGTTVSMNGLSTKIFATDSSGDATAAMIRLTSAGLRVQHTGGSGEGTNFEWNLSSLPGMSDPRTPRAVTISTIVTSMTNNTGNQRLMLAQGAKDNQVLDDATSGDVLVQAMRWLAGANWRARAWSFTSSSGKSIYSYANYGLGTSQPSHMRICMIGGPYLWWMAADTGSTVPGIRDIVGQRRLMSTKNRSIMDENGVAHTYVRWILGRGETTAVDLTLTSLRVYTFGDSG
jgi:hypothetical protein